jgi:hypothetical protein
MTFKGVDLTGLLTALIAIVGTLLGWAATWVKKKQQADVEASKVTAAWVKLAAIATAAIGKAWAKLDAEYQQRIVDGAFSPEDREALEKMIPDVLLSVVDKATLEEIATTVGIPFPGLVAWVANFFLDKYAKAHDPNVVTESKLAFPITADPGTDDPTGVMAGG